MKKEKSSGKNLPPKKSSRLKTFGASSLQINEQFDASRIVGGIVEKGFSQDPISEPQATVLPFPVARHRSHGPHWAPRASKFSNGVNDDEDDGEDEDSTEFDAVSAVANPIRRKQKKGLDFTQWRELMNSDNASQSRNKGENKSDGVRLRRSLSDDTAKLHDSKREGMDFTTLEILEKQEQKISDMVIDGMNRTLENGNHSIQGAHTSSIQIEAVSQNGMVEAQEEIMEKKQMQVDEDEDVEKQKVPRSHMTSNFSSNDTRNKQETMSIESEIDAENRARLEKMSTDEIAEAQIEIVQKMNPALVEKLKKRGQQKMKKKNSISDIVSCGQVGDLHNEKELINASPLSEIEVSQKLPTADTKDTHTVVESKVVPEVRSSNSSLWDAWSKNVEAARELRFSLDGDAVNDFVQVPKAGDVSAQSFYSTENVSERDFLRTEGDPGAVGYTIKEALALTRSMVPGQRSIALHLLESVLDKALENISQNQIGFTLKNGNGDQFVDWEAVWAFALGPEPELALSLRMLLDDNHNSVVLACAKVIQCVLSCDLNERFFDISEKIPTYQKDACTAPIFRSRPKIDVGFLQGGFWKYNTKSSNILPFGESTLDDKTEGEHTIQDDVVVAAQDFTAGLVRMGILPRIRYLLEADPWAALEECLISILIAIARHSPTCADAIMKCPRLLQVVVNRFTTKDQMEVNPSKIKSVTLMKVLAGSEKKRCMEFLENGIFQKMTWHLYRYAFSLDHWLNLKTEKCKLSSALLVEQLRFWKICISHGYGVSYFADLFPALCIWLDVPTFIKLIENNLLCEFASVTKEAYLVLGALTRTLPNFYSHVHKRNQTEDIATQDKETWCWNHVGPMVDFALKWIAFETDPYLSQLYSLRKENKGGSVTKDVELSSMLWVISAVLNMLSGVLRSVIPEDNSSLPGGHVPWLPDFVPKIGLQIIKTGFLSFSGVNSTGNETDASCVASFVELFCHFRHEFDHETSIASVCCLRGLVLVVVSLSKLIKLANTETDAPPSQYQRLPREDKILTDGILEHSLFEMRTLLTTFMKLIASERHLVQSVEMFGRGGPAPGVGVGWGASGGGFWSRNILLAQTDAGLLLHLLDIFPLVSVKDHLTVEEISFTTERVNCVLEICLVVGPKDSIITEKVLDIFLQPPVLKCLDLCIRHFLDLNKGLKLFGWQYKEEDYLIFSNTLASHFKSRWLDVKKKSKVEDKMKPGSHEKTKRVKFSLDTIHEDVDPSNMTNSEHRSTSLVVEWAHQRLPLPMNWFLSPISTTNHGKGSNSSTASNIQDYISDATNFHEVARCGLFFLLGLEAISTLLPSDLHSSVQSVSVIWKMHSLSVILFSGMEILEEEKSRDVYENLQEFYGQLLDKSRSLEIEQNSRVEFLNFQKEIHESYSTFIETLVENFAGASFGDLLFGRQVAIYLHRCVEAPVRLAAWNSLSNVRALELLPPLENCLANVEGYLEPMETDEKILEAYVKSWVSGALDRAVTRRSVAFTLVVHHLSSFIFGNHTGDITPLRNKLVKSILRDYSRKPQHEGMITDLILYKKRATSHKSGEEEDLQDPEIEKRFTLLKEACEGNSSLLDVVQKLEVAICKQHVVS